MVRRELSQAHHTTVMFRVLKKNFWYVVLLALVGLGIYAVNLPNPLFWDDTDWILNNPFVHSFSIENIKNWFTTNTLAGIGLKSNYYRPFLFFTFAVNYVLGGENPEGYHVVSNLLHVANSVLIFFLLLAVFKKRWIALGASLLWLVHPLHTEAVTYIAGRGDPLNVFFMLLALGLFWRAETKKKGWLSGLKISSLFLLVLALLSRETAIIFPFLALVIYISFLSGETFWRSVRRGLVKVWPYLAVVFAYGLLRLTVLNFENTLNFYAHSNPYTESFLVRMYTFLGVLWTYAKLMIFPVGLHMERGTTIFTSFFYWPVALSAGLVLSVLYLVSWFYKKEKLATRNQKLVTSYRVWWFAVGWFFVNLGPTSGITPINAQLYEHWLYLALLGPLVLVTFYLHLFWQKNGQRMRYGVIAFLVVMAVVFSAMTVKRNLAWGNATSFFEDILKYEPGSARINNNLGNLYFEKGDEKKAEEYYWQAVSVEDSFPQPHFNLGGILQERNDMRGAVVEFEKAIEIDSNFVYAYQNLAVIYAAQGDFVKSSAMLKKVVELRPDEPRAYYNLAKVEFVRKDPQAAIDALRQGLEVADRDPETKKIMEELLLQFIQGKSKK